jgi:hypothetical protein
VSASLEKIQIHETRPAEQRMLVRMVLERHLARYARKVCLVISTNGKVDLIYR